MTGARAKTLSTPRQITKAPRESPLRNGVLGQDSIMTRGRCVKPGWRPGQVCWMNRSAWVGTHLSYQRLPVPVEASANLQVMTPIHTIGQKQAEQALGIWRAQCRYGLGLRCWPILKKETFISPWAVYPVTLSHLAHFLTLSGLFNPQPSKCSHVAQACQQDPRQQNSSFKQLRQHFPLVRVCVSIAQIHRGSLGLPQSLLILVHFKIVKYFKYPEKNRNKNPYPAQTWWNDTSRARERGRTPRQGASWHHDREGALGQWKEPSESGPQRPSFQSKLCCSMVLEVQANHVLCASASAAPGRLLLLLRLYMNSPRLSPQPLFSLPSLPEASQLILWHLISSKYWWFQFYL